MAERIDPLLPETEPDEKLILNGRELDVFFEDIKLPGNYKRATCVKHLEDEYGPAAEVYNDFMLHEVEFPGDDEEPILRYRFECTGKTALGGCGLHIVQYDREGNKIS